MILYTFGFGISISEAGTSVLDTSFENRGRINSLKIEPKRSKSVKAKLSRLYLKLRQQTKMVGSNGTMIAIRLVRSKLRKREDHSNAVHPEAAVVQTATSPVSTIVTPSYPGEGCCTQTSVTTTSTDLGSSTAVEQDNVYATANPADQIVWQFPPPYPPPHTPAQYALYNDQVSTKFFSYFLTFFPLFFSFYLAPIVLHPRNLESRGKEINSRELPTKKYNNIIFNKRTLTILYYYMTIFYILLKYCRSSI